MRKLAYLIFLAAVFAGAQPNGPGGTTASGGTSLIPVKVASLSSYTSSGAGVTVAVKDGASSTDCSTGGGSTPVLCQYSGSSWSAIAGGGGSGLSGMTASQVPIAATATTVTSSKAIQGTDTSLLSSGTISGTSVALCTDANGGATTSGCGSGFSPTTFQSSAVTTNIAAANIVASAGSTKLYHFDWEVSLTVVGASCTGSTTVVVNAVLTDPNTSSPQTIALGTITIASLGNGTLGYVADGSESFYVKTGTALQYSTTSYTAGSGCGTNPTYQVTGEVF